MIIYVSRSAPQTGSPEYASSSNILEPPTIDQLINSAPCPSGAFKIVTLVL
jgi:hypothetical protein